MLAEGFVLYPVNNEELLRRGLVTLTRGLKKKLFK